jgi:hypothetical protein
MQKHPEEKQLKELSEVYPYTLEEIQKLFNILGSIKLVKERIQKFTG